MVVQGAPAVVVQFNPNIGQATSPHPCRGPGIAILLRLKVVQHEEYPGERKYRSGHLV